MTRPQMQGLIWMIIGSLLFVWIGSYRESTSLYPMGDFKAVYYAAQCLIQQKDPYKESELIRFFNAEDETSLPAAQSVQSVRISYASCINLPSTLFLVVPLAFLPWLPAHILWLIIIAVMYIVAAFLMWNLAAEHTPAMAGALIGLFLAGSEVLLEVGNTAGISVSLCVIAVWCFLKERLIPLGILCLALSLVIKPQDSGLVWLYFLLAGRAYRNRALKALLVALILSVPSIIWISSISPHWIQELHANLVTLSAHGKWNDPGPGGVDARFPGSIIISLQTVVSVFHDDPRFYNPLTYLLCAPLLLVWVATTLKKYPSKARSWLALAAIAAISMLPIYHRQHDAKLMLLMFPALSLLWSEGGPVAWAALLLSTSFTVISQGTILQILAIVASQLKLSTTHLSGQIVFSLLARPAPLVLLAMGAFYLWAYLRRARLQAESVVPHGREIKIGKSDFTWTKSNLDVFD